MKVMLIKVLMIIPTTIVFINTPMSMGVILLVQTILATMFISKVLESSWLPFIMFLMLIGGLLILFMYMSSIASNEKFKPSMLMFLMISVTLMFTMSEELMLETQIFNNLNKFESSDSTSILFFFTEKTFKLTLTMFLYLFLTMISVTFIIKIHQGPLRSKNYE